MKDIASHSRSRQVASIAEFSGRLLGSTQVQVEHEVAFGEGYKPQHKSRVSEVAAQSILSDLPGPSSGIKASRLRMRRRLCF
jgi:hypothetical protein